MLRTMIFAAALLAAGAPAHAQTSSQLTSGAWTCWMTSLTDDAGMDANLAFNPDGSLDGWFYMELPDGADVLGLEFSIVGNWTLNGAVISSNVTGSNVLSGAVNGEEFTAEELAEVADAMGENLAAFAGNSTIAYIAEHAMVLDEPEASVSCWR
jgi:hypothetical protein